MNTLPQTMGNTPLVYLEKYSKKTGANIFVKLENRNPGGSVKDRIAYSMIEQALKDKLITEGGTLIEPTSGNTGIGLACFAPFFGLKTILVMPESMSVERRMLLQAYGAQLVLTPAALGMKGAIAEANRLLEITPNSFMPNQFENPACPLAHYEGTGPEIYEFFQKQGLQAHMFISGVGTGGTVSGVGRYLKEKNPQVKIIAVEPSTSAVLSGKPAGVHGIQGIGAGFVPKNYHSQYIDEIFTVSTEDAKKAAASLIKEEGVSCGISSGANIFAALHYALLNKGKNIVTLIPDGVEKYLSTDMLTLQ